MELVVKYDKIKKRQSPQSEAAHRHRALPPLYSNNWMAKNRIYTIVVQPTSLSAKRKTHTDPRQIGKEVNEIPPTLFLDKQWGQTKFGAFLRKNEDKAQNMQKENEENTLEDIL